MLVFALPPGCSATSERRALLGRHYLVVERWDAQRVRSYLTPAVEAQEAATWPELAETIGGADADDGNLIKGDGFPGGSGVTFQYGAAKSTDSSAVSSWGPGVSHNLVEHDQVSEFSDGVAFDAAADQDIPAFSSATAQFLSLFLVQRGVKYSPPAEREPRYDTITANEMSADGLGISFGGPFRYNEVDRAPGPNDYQFYPIVESSSVAGRDVTVQLRLDDLPSHGHETFTIDLYAQGSCEQNSVTPGLGEHLLGQSMLRTGLKGE